MLVLRALLGVWATAVLVAPVAVAGLIAGWVALEARVFDHPRHRPSPPVLIQHPAPGLAPGDHTAFARALTAVAAAYLTECERQEGSRR